MKFIMPSMLIAIIFFSVSCKKENTAEPILIPKPDTLTSGWNKITVANNNINDIFFYNNSVGYLCNDNAIYKSIDGGATWVSVYNEGATNIFITKNGNAFFVSQFKSSLFKSVNGASTFSTVTLNQPSDIYFVNNNEGYYVSYFGLFKTIDSGDTWQKIPNTNAIITSPYISLCFDSTATSGLIVCDNGVFRNNGNISAWVKVNYIGGTNPSSSRFWSCFFTPNKNAFIINNNGELFKSLDSGVNFSLIQNFGSEGYSDIHFVDNNVGYISRNNRIYKTTDGGLNWSVVVALGEQQIAELHFTDASHGWACGSKDLVLKFN